MFVSAVGCRGRDWQFTSAGEVNAAAFHLLADIPTAVNIKREKTEGFETNQEMKNNTKVQGNAFHNKYCSLESSEAAGALWANLPHWKRERERLRKSSGAASYKSAQIVICNDPMETRNIEWSQRGIAFPSNCRDKDMKKKKNYREHPPIHKRVASFRRSKCAELKGEKADEGRGNRDRQSSTKFAQHSQTPNMN
jgi:hypothetical protein